MAAIAGPHQRQHDVPEDLEFAQAVVARGIEHVVGKLLDEIAHEQRAEAGLERGVEQDQRPARVVDPDRDREVAHRDHQDLERHEVAGDEDDEQREVAAKAELGEREARHAGERDRAHNGRHRDQHAVEDELGHARIGEHGRVVLHQPEFARPAPQVAAIEIVDRADRGQRNAEHRQEPDRKACVERGAVGEACRARCAFDGRWKHQPLSRDRSRQRKKATQQPISANSTAAIAAA